jgi:hypothetical protein
MLLQFVTFFAPHFSCWHSRVCFSFHRFHLKLHAAIANPTQELSFIRSFRSIPLQSLSGVYVFSNANILVVAALFRFTPQSFTTAHINPLSFFSLQSTTFTHYFQPLPFPTHCSSKKMRPNWLPAAPSHRAPRFLCLGHSLHSQRLAHNAQA